jgi:hypothetical protein
MESKEKGTWVNRSILLPHSERHFVRTKEKEQELQEPLPMNSQQKWLAGWLVGWFGWGWTIFGFELRVLHLLGRCYATWATPPALFSLVIFEIESHFLSTLAILLISASWISRIIGMSHWLLALWHKCPLKNERPLDHKKKSLQKESQQRQRKSSELLIKIRVEIN